MHKDLEKEFSRTPLLYFVYKYDHVAVENECTHSTD